MKEIRDILTAYKEAVRSDKKTALATVVRVDGSSYRRPGARMLITEDGNLTGAISGGCLEGDALKKALLAIVTQRSKLITYDSSDEDDAVFGVQLGCNGIVYILFEPIDPDDDLNPIAILTAAQEERNPAVIATLFSMDNLTHAGTIMLYRPNHSIYKLQVEIADKVANDAAVAYRDQATAFATYNSDGQSITALLEVINPSVSLIIAGAGNDTQPLAQMAYLIGWEVTIVDGRPNHATVLRYPTANRVLTAKPEEVLSHVVIDKHTAFVLMTHNYNYDLALLRLLLKTDAPYIGSLGPKKKLIRMLDDSDLNTLNNRIRVYGPVGLDIGAETAEEIALSILAEIKSVFSGASASFLKDKVQPIHVHDIKNS